MSAKVLTKAAAKEAGIDLIEDGSGSVRREALATERDRPRASWLQIFAHLAWWRCRVWTQATRLFKKSFEICATSGVPKGVERAHQGGRRFDDRQIRRTGAQNKVVRGIAEKTNRRPESFVGLGCF